jgi:penicillin amidase
MLEHQAGDLGLSIQGKGSLVGLWPEHCWEWFIQLLDKPSSPWFDLGKGEQRDDVLAMALRKAVDYLKKELGPEMKAWRYGKLHHLTFGHILGHQRPLDVVFNVGPFPIGGDGNTIWASSSGRFDFEPRPVVGPPFRFIADLGDLEHCWGSLAPGNSGHPASRYFKSGVKPWFKGEYHPMLFNLDEIKQNLDGKLDLIPADH